MNIPVTIVEEHHEAFAVWMIARERGKIAREDNALVHVDEHSDLGIPQLQRSVKELPNDAAGILQFTYEQLSIGNFILPTVYLGLIGEMYWVQHGTSMPTRQLTHVYSHLREGKTFKTTRDIHQAGVLSIDRKHFWYRRQSVGDQLPPLKSVLLDIDLDYFSCSDVPFHTDLEITQGQFERFVTDPYSPLRLHYGCFIQAYETQGRCYLRVPLIEGPDEVGFRVSSAEIVRRIEALERFLRDQPWAPQWITVCRSMISGYTPADQCEFIQQEVMKCLRAVYPVEIVELAGAGRDARCNLSVR